MNPPDPGRPGTPPVTGAPLGLLLRLGLRLKHGVRLGREVSRYGAEQRLWWLVPVFTVLVLFALAVGATTTVLPVAVYTLF